MLSDIDEIASQVQFQTSPDIPSMSTNKTSTDDRLYTEMIRHIVDLLKDSRQPVIVHILNGTCGRIWAHMHWNNAYISDVPIDDIILTKGPVPRNFPSPVTFDDYLKAVLEENQKFSQIQQNKSYQMIQQKMNVLDSWEKLRS